eukprot:Skav222695  [mRNA]  locus=scaffold402:113983:125798:+ [translate_table: standard]
MASSGPVVLEIVSKGTCRCSVKANGCLATLVAEEKWVNQLLVGDLVCLHNPKATWDDCEMIFHVDQGEGAHMLIRHCQRRGKVATAEIYAGLSGWDAACRIMGFEVDIFVEKDLMTAEMCAAQHACAVVSAKQFIDQFLREGTWQKCVICGDCQDPEVWSALGLANVGTIFASPPCPPWCSVGRSSGLCSSEGELLPATGKWAGKLGVALLLLENVAGLPKHPDFPTVIQEIERFGLKLKLHGTFSIHKIMPIRRDRWLATFVHSAVHTAEDKVQLAQSITYDNRSFLSVALSPSMNDADAVHVNMSDYERRQLVIPDDAKIMMSNIKYAPVWLKAKGVGGTPDQVFQARILSSDAQCTGVMASYGRQHKLPEDLLESSGLHTSTTQDQHGCRYFSPWEFVSLLGYGDQVTLSSDLQAAWQLGGNGLSVAHGWLQLHKTHLMLGEMSPFQPQGTAVEQIQRFQEGAIKLSNFCTVVDGKFWKLQALSCEHVDKKCRHAEIPATIPIESHDESEVEIPQGTMAWTSEPQFESVMDPRCVAVEGQGYADGMIVLMHEQKHWAMFVNCPRQSTVAAIVLQGLPHAVDPHFCAFTIEGDLVQWTSVIQCDKLKTLVFSPKHVPIMCREESLHIALQMVIDVTWTGKTAAAYGAVKLGCNPDVLSFSAKEVNVCDDDYLLAYETEEFGMKFKSCLPRYVEWSPVMTQVQDEGLKPVRSSQERWFARHPSKKVIRTVVADYDTDVVTLVQKLFPDLHGTSIWKVVDSQSDVPTDAFANAWDLLHVQWEGFRPLRVSEMQRVSLDMAIDNPVGTVILDPITTVDQCDDDGVISFRLCPLVGGAKHEQVRQRLKKMLEDKGVPSDKTLDRLNGFASKASMEKLAQLKDVDDEDFWNSVKSMATDLGYRLITSQELKAHQQQQRKVKTKGDKGSGKGCDSLAFVSQHGISFLSEVEEVELSVRRIGEADNPGPQVHPVLNVWTCNPAQLLGNEEVIAKWPPGLVTIAESSHTESAMHVIQARFKKHGINMIAGTPVAKLTDDAGVFRGRALGTVSVSQFPLQPYPVKLDEVVCNIGRSSDALVNLGDGMMLYSGVIYGPTSANYYYADPEAVFDQATSPIIERACAFRGPAILSGDFNRELESCKFWPLLKSRGWWDAAELALQRFQWTPEPTCRNTTRRSFILVNPMMAERLLECKTVEHHCFDAHPVLQAQFQLSTSMPLRKVWNLPRSADDILFDDVKLHDQCQLWCHQHQNKFEQYLDQHLTEDAFALFVNGFEQGCRLSAVDVVGNAVVVPEGCFKKGRNTLVKHKPMVSPVLKEGRQGDVKFAICQPSTWLRQRIAQVRRLKSLVGQVNANCSNEVSVASLQSEQLWQTILQAPGFRGGFAQWTLIKLKMYVPVQLPHVAYLRELLDEVEAQVHINACDERNIQFRNLRERLADDIRKGGSYAYRGVRDAAAPPLTYIGFQQQTRVRRTRWPKEGRTCIYKDDSGELTAGLPMVFQDQQVYIDKLQGDAIWTSDPLKLLSDEPEQMVATQQCTTAEPQRMQKLVCDAWSGTVVLHRLEQLAPFPAMSVALVCSQYPHAELCWVQEMGLARVMLRSDEEPKNMGPWSYVAPRLSTALRELTPEGFGVPEARSRCVWRRLNKALVCEVHLLVV